MILAKEFEGELWVKAADHNREVNRLIAAEREACAKLCDDLPVPPYVSDNDAHIWDLTCVDCAAAIRARGRSEALTNLNKAAEDMGQEL